MKCPYCKGRGDNKVEGTPFRQPCADCNRSGSVMYCDNCNEFCAWDFSGLCEYCKQASENKDEGDDGRAKSIPGFR
jgi:RecJ-like exonuclease